MKKKTQNSKLPPAGRGSPQKGGKTQNSICYLSLGSNLGNRYQNLQSAIRLLKKSGIVVKKKSSVYETEPVGHKNQPWFLNQVVCATTRLAPVELLKVLKNLEKTAGRRKTFRWGPRVIDMDLLLYIGCKMRSRTLTLPHPRLSKRAFVLIPLAEIAPQLPVSSGKTALEILKSIDKNHKEKVFKLTTNYL